MHSGKYSSGAERGAFWGSNFLVEVRPGKYSSGERCILGNTHPERSALWGVTPGRGAFWEILIWREEHSGTTHPERGSFWGSNVLVEVRPGKYSSGKRCILGNTHPERGAFWENTHPGERCILGE